MNNEKQSRKENLKYAFFFGAGAEVPYGMPSGGEFALEIFRSIGAEDKTSLREQISKVDKSSHQISWFPDDVENKSVTVFGKNNFDSIISSTLEVKRKSIIQALLNLDKTAERVKSEFNALNIDISDILTELGCEPGANTYAALIVLSDMISNDELKSFFGAAYFSSLIDFIKLESLSKETKPQIELLARSLIELLVGALGQDLVHELNNGIFKNKPDELSFLDDIGGLFSLDYRRIGLDAFDYILKSAPFNERKQQLEKIAQPNLDTNKQHKIVVQFYLRIAELIFSEVADYQSLVDSHYRYLFKPRNEWGKFCKITTFLFAVHRYMQSCLSTIGQIHSYYEDICDNKLDITAIGTSNYTNLVNNAGFSDVKYLNGSLSQFYDPYRNEIEDEDESRFQVPFIFTQSGTKPLTSIKMSRQYVEFYDNCEKADALIVLGYGFNIDDGHINTLIRSWLEKDNKKLIVVDYQCDNLTKRKQEIVRRLRTQHRTKVQVFSVDNKRQINDGNWLKHILKVTKS